MKQLIVVLAVLLMNTAIMAEPVLKIPSAKYKFGTVPQESTILHYFWFKSTGEDTVFIDKVVTGCKCTITDFDRDFLAPNDSVLVGIHWKIGRLIGNSGQYPRVFYNGLPSPAQMAMTCLTVKSADSARPISMAPYKAELAIYGEIQIDSVAFTFTNHLDEALSISQVSYDIKQCHLSLPDSIPANGQVTGVVKILPDYADSEFMSSFTVEFSDKQKSRLTIPVRRKIY